MTTMEPTTDLHYMRSKDGTTVHLSSCTRVGSTTVAWPYADGLSPDQMLTLIASHRWLLPCKFCKPTT